MKTLFNALKLARKLLAREANKLPDRDAYATPYSILIYLIKDVDAFLKSYYPAYVVAESMDRRKQSIGNNRAKDWLKP